MIKNIVVAILILFFLSSCAPNKKIIYMHDQSGFNENLQNYTNTLQPDDILSITITSDEPELANDFNIMYLNLRSTEMRTLNDESLYTYLIDQNGEIEFPVLGKIKMAGLTRNEAEEAIKKKLKDYLVNPGVNLRVVNFKVSVLGEVQRPGVQRIQGDRVSILEALSMAGDMTIYGKRQEVMLIREKDGVKTMTELDITKADFVNSPYYYLSHNDVVYIKPNRTRVNSSVIGPNLTVGISAISLLITIITLSTR